MVEKMILMKYVFNNFDREFVEARSKKKIVLIYKKLFDLKYSEKE